MKYVVVDSNTGKIERCGYCKDDDLILQGVNAVKAPSYVDDSFYYTNGKFIKIPEKPNEYTEFDFVDKIWKENSLKKAKYTSKLKKEIIKNTVSEGFTYDGLNFQIDADSRLSIVGKALELELDTDITTVNWISNTKDGEGNDIIHRFIRDEFIEFAKEVAKYYESVILGVNNAT